MNAIGVMKLSLEMSKSWIMALVTDMKDAPLTPPTPNGGNHPLWVIGHLTYSEANLVCEYIKGDANPLKQWKEIFAGGSQPTLDPSRYPPMEEVLARFEQIRNETMRFIDSLSEEALDKPSHAPNEMKPFFGTVAQCLAAIPIHFAFHGGQVADARRAAGRAPLMG